MLLLSIFHLTTSAECPLFLWVNILGCAYTSKHIHTNFDNTGINYLFIPITNSKGSILVKVYLISGVISRPNLISREQKALFKNRG